MPFNIVSTDFLNGYFVCLPLGPTSFIPLFQVPAIYCLSISKAQELMADLNPDLGAAVALVQDNPEGPNFGTFVVKNFFGITDKVPFFELTGASGKKFRVNAGILANWFNHGYDPAWAMTQAIADLKGQIAAN